MTREKNMITTKIRSEHKPSFEHNYTILLVLFFVTIWSIIVGLAGYYLGRLQFQSEPCEESSSVYESWTRYSNSEYGYSFQYPEDWTLSEDGAKESDSKLAATIVTIRSPDSGNVLKIDYSGELNFYSILKRNTKETDFSLWGKKIVKAFLYCHQVEGKIKCSERSDDNEVFFAILYDRFGDDPEKYTENTWYLSDPEGNDVKVYVKYKKYNESDDMIFDLILHSIQYSS